MKLKIKDIYSNPYKKEINKGKLDESAIKKIQSNIKKLGLMGSLPLFKKDKKHYLIAGHHRLEALKREYGKNFEVEVVVHNYKDDDVLRGMIVENLTQRRNEFREEADNLLLIRKYLKKRFRSPSEQNPQGGRPQEKGSISDIYGWLNTNGEVMSRGRISSILSITDNLDSDLLEQVTKKGGIKLEENGDSIAYKDALNIARIEDKEEQKEVAKAILKQTETNFDERGRMITAYKNAPEEIKEQVRSGELDISEVENQTEMESLKARIREGRQEQDQEVQVIHSQEIVEAVRSEIVDTYNMLDRLMNKIKVVRSRGGTRWFTPQSKKEFGKLVSNTLTKIDKWRDELIRVKNELGD